MFNPDAKNKKKKVWEVFPDEAQLSNYLEEHYADKVEVERFSLQTGWDFRRKRDRDILLDKVDKDKPDEIFMVPPSEPWCSWQRVNAAINPQIEARIRTTRLQHESCFLKLAHRIFEKQFVGGRHAHLEHPDGMCHDHPQLRI